MKPPIAVVVLAAGAGTRMKSAIPKVLHPLAGWPMVRHVLENVGRLRPARVVGVVAPGASEVAAAFAPHPTAVQRRPLGTGDATKAALGALKGHRGPVLVVYADAPLLTTATLQRLVAACRKAKAAVGVLGFVARDPTPYGRLIMHRGDAGEDRREPRRRREREGGRFLQFRRDVPRRRTGRVPAGRDQERQRQEGVLSDRCRRHRARRGPHRDRRRRRRGGIPGHQFARRAGDSGEGLAAAPARGRTRGGRQHDRPRHGVAVRRHQAFSPTSRSAPTCASGRASRWPRTSRSGRSATSRARASGAAP